MGVGGGRRRKERGCGTGEDRDGGERRNRARNTKMKDEGCLLTVSLSGERKYRWLKKSESDEKREILNKKKVGIDFALAHNFASVIRQSFL